MRGAAVNFIKVCIACFAFDIRKCLFSADERNSDFYFDLRIVRRVKRDKCARAGLLACNICSVQINFTIAPSAVRFKRAGKFRREMQSVWRRIPAADKIAYSLDTVRRNYPRRCRNRALPPAASAARKNNCARIEQQISFVRL